MIIDFMKQRAKAFALFQGFYLYTNRSFIFSKKKFY